MVPNQEVSKDIQDRVAGFNKEVTPLLKKYRLVLGALPVILPDGRLAANPHVFAAEEVQQKPAKPEGKQEKEDSGLAKS